MLEETGRVVDVQDEFAWVENERTTTCGACNVRKGCGTAVLAKVFGQRRLNLRVLNRIDAHIGDDVVIGIPESGLLRGSLAVYAAPLAGLFAGALTGNALGGSLFPGHADLPAIAGAVAGLALGLLWLRRFSRSRSGDEAFQPVILRRQVPGRETQFPVHQ